MAEDKGGGLAETIIAAAAKHADKLSKIKLRGGMVGRVTWVMIVLCLSAAGMVWSVKNIWVTLAGLLMMFGTVNYLGIKLIRFAHENPQAALMEGAELLIHEQMQMQMGMKAKPEIETSIPDEQAEPLKHPTSDTPEVVDVPDELESPPSAATAPKSVTPPEPPGPGTPAVQAGDEPSQPPSKRSRRKDQ